MKAGIQRFVLLSSIYARRPDQDPENLQRYLHAKNAADVSVAKSGLDYTILRPGYLNDEPGTGMLQIGDAFEGTDAQISREDVAEVIVMTLSEPKTIGVVFEFINGKTPIAEALAKANKGHPFNLALRLKGVIFFAYLHVLCTASSEMARVFRTYDKRRIC